MKVIVYDNRLEISMFGKKETIFYKNISSIEQSIFMTNGFTILTNDGKKHNIFVYSNEVEPLKKKIESLL